MRHWDGKIDRNMFVSEDDREAFADKGCDADSIVGDPVFVDPANGDYTIGEKSPFLAHGFVNFPMDRFGVEKPGLKAIARAPDFPTPKVHGEGADQRSEAGETWMGAAVADLKGEEFSAFGVKREDGGIHLVSVPTDSAAARAGLKEGDLVQFVDAHPVRTIGDFRKRASCQPGKKLSLRLVRNCRSMSMEIVGRR